MHRRGFLSLAAGFIASHSAADTAPPSAIKLVRPVMPPQDISSLMMTNAAGAPVALSGYLGRIIVLNLWGSWCQPCRREMPSLSRLADLVDPAEIVVLPLAFDRKGAAPVRRFFKSTGVTNLPILIGDGQNLQTVLGQGLLPTTLILSTSGQHIYTVKGEASWDDAPTIKWLNYLASEQR